MLVVLLAESLPIGRVEKDPVKLQVVYGLGADAGRASLDLLKYELLKAEQVFIEQRTSNRRTACTEVRLLFHT